MSREVMNKGEMHWVAKRKRTDGTWYAVGVSDDELGAQADYDGNGHMDFDYDRDEKLGLVKCVQVFEEAQ